MLDKIKLGTNIKEARKAKGMKQIDLANDTELSRSYICDVENGRYVPSIDSLMKISAALELPLNELVK